ncbi:MAG: tyrosine-type recombinase/integrase [Candidatus Omnitrophota bacterium]
MKRYIGVKETKAGHYQVNFRLNKNGKRFWETVEANSMQEAYNKRAELITQRQKELQTPEAEKLRLTAGFSEVWEGIGGGILGERKPRKTYLHYQKVFWRMFDDFRNLKFPYVQNPSQLTLAFFEEYKNYYSNELNRPKGLRGELIYVKAIMKRMYKLGFCSEKIIKDIAEHIKKPKPNKKYYPEITNTKINELLVFIKKDRPDYYGPIYFMKRTGRRVEETTLIERRDVIWDGIKPIKINIRAETTKTDEYTPLNQLDSELEILIGQAYKESSRHRAPYLFLSRRHKKLNQRRICDYLKIVSEKITGIKFTCHYFRHRYWVECGKNNVPIIDAMAISGNKDSDVVITFYSHSTSEGLAKVLELTSR